MIEDTLKQMREQIEKTRKELQQTEEDFENLIQAHFHISLWKNVKKEEIIYFVKKPYVIIPFKEGEWRLFIPKFIPLEVGWLEFQTDSYNVFRANKYVDWLTPLPEVLKEELGIYKPEFELSFDWNKSVLNVEKGNLERAKKKYGRFIYRQLNHSTFQIKSTQRFNFMLELLKDGILPFRSNPVNPEDFYENERAKFELRDYQKDAWNVFLKYSHIGVFYPYAAGKSILGLYAVSKIKGLKLVVVPSLTLKEQWEKRIEEMIDGISRDEFIVVTYQSATKEWVRRKEYSLIVFDEVHHLPANIYSLFSFVRRKYTIGLSGSPYREDGRSELIFALTGFPIGADWNYFWKKGIVKKPKIKVIIVKGHTEKIFELDKLLKEKSVTLVYCDSLHKGKELASRFKGEFIYSETKKRLNAIDKALDEIGFVILSRVGDEGISLPTIQRVIEFDFLFGSRRQESQRVGRLFHATEQGEHYILMTADEFQNYKKRLYSLMEKGLELEMENKS
jgi:DNA excision repair protein ERCC-3